MTPEYTATPWMMFALQDFWVSITRWTSAQLGTPSSRRKHQHDIDTIESHELISTSLSVRKDEEDSTNRSKADHTLGKKRFRKGWRFGAASCAVSATVVFLINLVITIWGSVYDKKKGNVLYSGDCEQVSRLNTGLHLLINILSTVLLSSSNYCMQCLSAPTRKEIDQAHARGEWLDIGVPSIRNLFQIERRRASLWLLLGLSSLPLHLFYNSAVFSSTSSNDYYAYAVGQSFVDSSECCDNISWNYTLQNAETSGGYYPENNPMYNSENSAIYNYEATRLLHEKARRGTLDRMSNAECIGNYSKMIQPDRRNVLLIVEDSNYPPANDSIVVYAANQFTAAEANSPWGAVNSYSWICALHNSNNGTCAAHIDDIKSAPDMWSVGNLNPTMIWNYEGPTYRVNYCLSESTPQLCKLQFIQGIMVLVTILNFFKVILIVYVALRVEEEPLMTMGDAVVSFLETEDPTTTGMCLLSVHDLNTHKTKFPQGPREWVTKKRRWKDVTSWRRRAVTILLFSVTLIAIASLFARGVLNMPPGQSRSLAALAQLGYGTVNPLTTIIFGSKKTTTQNILIANTPQLALSFLYFTYNGLFTCMLLGYEWSTYAHQRKGLRVSRAPVGAQRSTYFLSLPYRFALPLMVLSGALHWLVSQSVFLVAINAMTWNGLDGESWTSCGYSPMPILSVLGLGTVMIIAIVGFGFVPFKPGMTLARSCSAVISAACHNAAWNKSDGYSTATEKLKWGVAGMNTEGVGHCTFSSKDVEFPREGVLYAG